MQKRSKPKIIPREKHCISRNNISPSALKVLYRLHEAGFAAYLVGGSVRDLLLGTKPKDFDIATDALPEEVRQLFRNCILVGRRFRLAHIRFGREIIEVATFRGEHHKATGDEARSVDGLIVRDNVYGTLEEDAWRRDFTINSLYYNIADLSVVDYCEGMKDLQKKQITILGDPIQRYQEDPVRLLRAVRFAAKLNFQLSNETAEPIKEMSYLLHQVAAARLFEEVMKLFLKGHAAPTFEMCLQYGLFKELFPSSAICIQHSNQYPVLKFIQMAMQNSDLRIAAEKTITPAFILAVLLWHPLLLEIEHEQQKPQSEVMSIENAIRITLKKQQQLTTIPRRFSQTMIEIWRMQFRMRKRSRRSIFKLLTHPRFRAAYDFLILRADAGEDVKSLSDWWITFYESDEETRSRLLRQLPRAR